MKIEIPQLSLVVLIGASGSGKSTFAKKHFLETEVLSLDLFRAMVADDYTDQSVSEAAFEALHLIAEKRLAKGKLTVIDATNLSQTARETLIQIAKKHHVMLVGILFDIPENICLEQNEKRDSPVPAHVIRRQVRRLHREKRRMKKERFRYFYTLTDPEEAAKLETVRTPLKVDKREEQGSFDLIGDVHGCFDELCLLLQKLGYRVEEKKDRSYQVTHLEGRRVVFLGDLVDRGPDSPRVLQLVMDMVEQGIAFCVCGNHDDRLARKLSGKKVHLRHGLKQTLEQMESWPEDWREKVCDFLKKLPHHYVLDQGRLVVAHAGLIEEYHGRSSGKVRSFALYGDTTGEKDKYGFPIRRNWAASYRGKALVVYGHTPVQEPIIQNETINIDTGCVFGGRLTALRYPEKSFVSVEAKRSYDEFVRPLFTKADFLSDNLLDLSDVYGNQWITTQFHSPIRIYADQSAAALEVVSRYIVDPRWLIYLPPTMSPSETTTNGHLLEHPHDAFRYYQKRGVNQLICEEKHMGSRVIVIVCRDDTGPKRRFGIDSESLGICYSRTGRRFFDDKQFEQQFLRRLQQALTRSGFWDQFNTHWVCLDCELMPWSAKAQQLLVDQYASVGAAAYHSLSQVLSVLQQAKENGQVVEELQQSYLRKQIQNQSYIEAYRHYVWPVESIDEYRLAPFHLLATPHYVVDLQDPSSIDAVTRWWEELTEQGGEGMVVKPIDFVVKKNRELIQPALKCRGREYLRIVYGPEYTSEQNLIRLSKRSLKKKRSLAIREFALGLEALTRFVNEEPLHRVHQCCFGILEIGRAHV